MKETEISKCLRLMGELRTATGMRLDELIHLEWRDVGLSTRMILIPAELTKQGRARVQSLSVDAYQVLLQALEIGPPCYPLVFPNLAQSGKPFSRAVVTAWFSRHGVPTRRQWAHARWGSPRPVRREWLQ